MSNYSMIGRQFGRHRVIDLEAESITPASSGQTIDSRELTPSLHGTNTSLPQQPALWLDPTLQNLFPLSADDFYPDGSTMGGLRYSNVTGFSRPLPSNSGRYMQPSGGRRAASLEDWDSSIQPHLPEPCDDAGASTTLYQPSSCTCGGLLPTSHSYPAEMSGELAGSDEPNSYDIATSSHGLPDFTATLIPPQTYPSELVEATRRNVQSQVSRPSLALANNSPVNNVADMPIANFAQANHRRGIARHQVNHPHVPGLVDEDPQFYAQAIHDAMVNLEGAQDGVRKTHKETDKKPSTGFKRFRDNTLDDLDIWAASWKILEKLIKLHHMGCSLYDHGQCGPEGERDLPFNDRFRDMITLLKFEKNACYNAIKDGDMACERIVCAPNRMRSNKTAYRKINDKRGQKALAAPGQTLHPARRQRAKVQSAARPAIEKPTPTPTDQSAVGTRMGTPVVEE